MAVTPTYRMKPKPTRRIWLAPALTVAIAGICQQSHAANGTWTTADGGATTRNWSDTANWNSGVVGSGTDAVATFPTGSPTNTTAVAVDANITIGKLVFSNISNTSDLNLRGSTGNTLTFATSTGTPMIEATVMTNKLLALGNGGTLNLGGNQGLVIRSSAGGALSGSGLTATATAPAKQLRITSVNWSAFSGGVTVDRGEVGLKAANQLGTGASTQNLTVGTSDTTTFNTLAGVSYDQDTQVGRLNGTALGRIWSGTSGRIFTVGVNDATGGDFGGVFGVNFAGAAMTNTLTKVGTGTQTFSGLIGGASTVNASAGTLVLSGNNNFTGTTTVGNGANLRLGNSNALGTTAGGTTVNSGGTLDLNGQSIGETVSITGSGAGGNGALINSNTLAAAALSTDIVNPGNLTIGGAGDISLTRIRSSGAFTVTKVGTGTLTTNGTSHNNLAAWDIQAGKVVFANTGGGYGADRGVTLNGGTLQLSGGNSNLVNDAEFFTINSGTFDINGKGEAVAAVGGSGGTITNSSAAEATLYVGGGGNGTSSASYGGVIADGTGTLSLTKEGSGTQTLTGFNTYTGTTSIRKGTIALDANGTISNTLVLGSSSPTTGSLDVTAKAMFSQADVSGSGTINIGAGKTVTITGNLTPGFSPGALNVTGNLALTANTSTTMEIGGNGGGAGADSDYLNVTGSLTLDGLLAIVSYNGYDLSQDGTYNLFDAVSFSGDFDGVTVGGSGLSLDGDNWVGVFGGNSYVFSEATGVLQVAAVPEPSVFLLVGFPLLSLLRRRR